jgi:hypothetical protein
LDLLLFYFQNCVIKKHEYYSNLTWVANLSLDSEKYNSYRRGNTIEILNKVGILGSSDPALLVDKIYIIPKTY